MITAPAQLAPRAFTLLEMLVAITILALAATIVAPMFNNDDRLHVQAASSVVSSDIELAQLMTMSFPTQPVVVRFDPANATYWLAYAADPETPMTREGSAEPYLVELGVGRAASAQGVSFVLDQLVNDVLEFDSMGSLVDFTATPMIEFSRGGDAITLSIAPTTGTISEFAGTIEELASK